MWKQKNEQKLTRQKEKRTLWWKENVSKILWAFPPPLPISSFDIESNVNLTEGSSSYWQVV